MFNSMREPEFLKKFFVLVLPIALQELLLASLHNVDTIMIGKTGGINMAAVNLANKPFFIFLLLMLAITSGSSVFTAQYWGNRDLKGVSRSFGVSFSGAILCSILFSIISLTFPHHILKFFSDDPILIKQGVKYLKIIAYSYIFTAATASISSLLRSTKQPRIPLIISTFSIIVNTILNYLLIFGKFGFPKLEIEGAAIATLIAKAIETSILYVIVYSTNNRAAPIPKLMFSWDKKFLRSYGKICLPILANDLGWATGFTFYSKIYGMIGTSALTTISIIDSTAYLFITLFIGTGHAAAAILGNQMGKGELKESREDANRILQLVIFLSICISFAIICFSSYIPLLFNASDYVRNTASALLIIFALSLPFKVINMNVIAGILRSGGDTLFSALLDISGVWLIGVPLGLTATKFFGWGIEAVFAIIMIEELYKTTLCIWRMYSGKWVKKLV